MLGSIYAQDGILTVKDVQVGQAESGLKTENCHLEVTSSTFSDCDTSILFRTIDTNCVCTVESSVFNNNNIAIYGVGLVNQNNKLEIINSLFYDNYSDSGIIVADSNTNLYIVNSTISNNTSHEAVTALGTSNILIIKNSILYNNPNPQIFCEGLNNVTFSDIEGGWDGYGNINNPPLFDSLSAYPYQLLTGSLCIDAGNPDTTCLNLPELDLDGNPRIWNNHVDMGAFEWNNIGVENPQYANNNLVVYPNPVSDMATLIFNAENKGLVHINLYNSSGVKINNWEVNNYNEVKNKLVLDFIDLTSGIYLISVQVGDKILIKKVVKL